jgi:hypothetical protein
VPGASLLAALVITLSAFAASLIVVYCIVVPLGLQRYFEPFSDPMVLATYLFLSLVFLIALLMFFGSHAEQVVLLAYHARRLAPNLGDSRE